MNYSQNDEDMNDEVEHKERGGLIRHLLGILSEQVSRDSKLNILCKCL